MRLARRSFDFIMQAGDPDEGLSNPSLRNGATGWGAGLVVVCVGVRRRWRWHGERRGHVEGIAGNRAVGRIAADFGIGEQGFVSPSVHGGDRDVEGVARIEAESLG